MRWSLEEDRILAARCKAQLKGKLAQDATQPLSGAYTLHVESGGEIVHDWTDIALGLPLRNNKDCRKRWVNVVAGHIKKGQWTEDEDHLLIDAVRRHLSSGWPAVAQKLHSRSPDQCAKRWQQNLNPDLDRGAWTADEDRTLCDAVRKYGRSWVKIRDRHFPKRATNTIKNHYSMLLKKPERAASRSKSVTTTPPPSHVDLDSLYASRDATITCASSESSSSPSSITSRPSLSWSVPSTPESLSSQSTSWDALQVGSLTHVDPKLVESLPLFAHQTQAYPIQAMSSQDPFSTDTATYDCGDPDAFQDWCLSTLDPGFDLSFCCAPDHEFDPELGEWVLPTTELCGEGAAAAATNDEYILPCEVRSVVVQEPFPDALVSPMDLVRNQLW